MGFDDMYKFIGVADQLPICSVSSETSLNLYQATSCYVTECSTLHNHRGEEIKTYIPVCSFRICSYIITYYYFLSLFVTEEDSVI
jgi:hypothetical protein